MKKQKIDVEEIIKKEEKLIYHLVHKYIRALHMYEFEDIRQEVILALYETLKFYKPGHGAKLVTVWYSQAERRLSKLNRSERALKRTYIRVGYLETQVCEEGAFYSHQYPSGEDLEKDIIKQFEKEELYKMMTEIFSDLEWQVFNLYFKGVKQYEIAEQLGMNTKKIENIIFRAKYKLKQRKK